MGGSRHGIGRQLLATVATFIYIYIWHGCRLYIATWTIVNFVGIILEIMGRKFQVLEYWQMSEVEPFEIKVDEKLITEVRTEVEYRILFI